MNFDALTVLALRDELRATVVGGKVQHVHHPDELGVAIDLYAQGRSRWLYLSAHSEHARVHLVSERPPRTSEAITPLLLLLRKYVDGARLDAVDQPPLERILHFHFSKRLPTGVTWHRTLVAEVMGRRSNLIFVDEDGSVVDAIKRVTDDINRVRTVLPQQRYQPPPMQDKLDPRDLREFDLVRAVADIDGSRPARRVLVDAANACSPLLAREVIFRVHAGADVPAERADWPAVARTLREIWEEAGRLAPTVAYEGDQMVAFAPYTLHCFPDVRPVTSISAALEEWYATAAPLVRAAVTDAARKRSLAQALEEARDRLRAKRFSLGKSDIDPADVARLRESGEALLAYGAQVAPGSRELRPPDGGAVIELDPLLSAVENAQRYFDRYARARTAARDVPEMIRVTENELAYLDEASTLLDLASSPADLNALRDEWAELGYVSPSPKSKKNARRQGSAGRSGRGGRGGDAGRRIDTSADGYERRTVDGFDILIGRSGTGNDNLLRRAAQPDDVWLHARGVPGAHVLVKTGGRSVPEPVIRQAAALAAARSQARSAPTVAVDHTQRRHVERIKGAPPGLVSYRGERTIHVAPAIDPPLSRSASR